MRGVSREGGMHLMYGVAKPNARKSVFPIFEIARGRGWQGEGIGHDEGAREEMTRGDASDGCVSALFSRTLLRN